MKAEVRDVDDVRIISLKGKISIGAGDVKIRELVDEALAGGKKKIVLDLENVSAIDSSGIGEMVSCYTTVTRQGGKLALLKLSPKINDILQVTQLITVFDVHDSEEEAIAALR